MRRAPRTRDGELRRTWIQRARPLPGPVGSWSVEREGEHVPELPVVRVAVERLSQRWAGRRPVARRQPRLARAEAPRSTTGRSARHGRGVDRGGRVVPGDRVLDRGDRAVPGVRDTGRDREREQRREAQGLEPASTTDARAPSAPSRGRPDRRAGPSPSQRGSPSSSRAQRGGGTRRTRRRRPRRPGRGGVRAAAGRAPRAGGAVRSAELGEHLEVEVVRVARGKGGRALEKPPPLPAARAAAAKRTGPRTRSTPPASNRRGRCRRPMPAGRRVAARRGERRGEGVDDLERVADTDGPRDDHGGTDSGECDVQARRAEAPGAQRRSSRAAPTAPTAAAATRTRSTTASRRPSSRAAASVASSRVSPSIDPTAAAASAPATRPGTASAARRRRCDATTASTPSPAANASQEPRLNVSASAAASTGIAADAAARTATDGSATGPSASSRPSTARIPCAFQ